MEYVIAIGLLAVACGLWVVVQLAAGRAPRACKGDASCESSGLRSCSRGGGRCPLAEPGSDAVVPEGRLTGPPRTR